MTPVRVMMMHTYEVYGSGLRQDSFQLLGCSVVHRGISLTTTNGNLDTAVILKHQGARWLSLF